LVTPARDEEAHLEQLVRVMTSQTRLPLKWVIVDDGSADRTGVIASACAVRHSWVEAVHLPAKLERGFAAKALSFRAGYERVRHLEYNVIGNLDADLSFDTDYLEFLLDRFAADATLGVAGTIFVEDGYDSARDSFEGENHVPGGCQLFRRECFEQIGGYVPVKIGMDWIAVTTARMLGWKTQSFRDKVFVHHRPLGTGGRRRQAAWRLYGEKDYLLGWHPVYEICRLCYQAARNPWAGLNIALGYAGAVVRRPQRSVPPELMRFHRAEQMTKLKGVMRHLLLRRRLEKFAPTADRTGGSAA
jgi:glycosyltransferase involved in cell wall biosynthesis